MIIALSRKKPSSTRQRPLLHSNRAYPNHPRKFLFSRSIMPHRNRPPQRRPHDVVFLRNLGITRTLVDDGVGTHGNPGGVVVVGGFGDDVGPAERAVGVGPEPHVDAGHVEGVAAFGQEPESVVLAELAEANRAVRAVDQALALSVPNGGDGVYDRLLQAHRSDEPDRVLVVVHELVSLSAVGLYRGQIIVVISPPSASCEQSEAGLGNDDVAEEEEQEAGEQGEQNDDGRRDAVVLVVVLVGDGEI